VDRHVFGDRDDCGDARAGAFGHRVADALRRPVNKGDRRRLGKIGDAIPERDASRLVPPRPSATLPAMGVPAAIMAATWLRA